MIVCSCNVLLEGRIDVLETQIELVKEIGVERYIEAHIDGLGEGGSPGFREDK